METKSEGNLNAKIYLIGEAFGATEEREGKPFRGGAGQVLNKLLKKAGIAREECYIDNVIQSRPPGNNFGIYYQDSKRFKPKDALLDAHARIKGLIKSHRPNIVVPLGGEALIAVTGNRGILKWRGSILGCDGVKVIPTLHPAAVMRQPELDPIATLDFNRIVEESVTPMFPKPYIDSFVINPNFDDCMRYLIEILPHAEYLAFDIETLPANGNIMCMGFAWSKEKAFCLPICFGASSWWTEVEEMELIKAMRTLFASPKIKFIAQNAQYDLTYIKDKWGIDVKNLWMDTMIGFHCVYPEMKKSLAFLTSVYTKRPYYKDDGGQGKTPEQEWIYNCKDVCATYECAMAIRDDLIDFGTFKFYQEHSHQVIQPLLQMQSDGVLIDLGRRNGIDRDLSMHLTTSQVRLDKAVGYDLNVGSPKQMVAFLYEDLGLPPQYKMGMHGGKKTKVITANENAIEKLQKITQNPALALVLEIRGINKLLSTYVRMELEKNNRVCCSYKITGTTSGRLASTKSIYNRGTNLQNIPVLPSIRSMFIADPGMILVNADLSQAEARVVAYLAEDERMIHVFENDEDIHRINASIIFGIPVSEVTETQRTMAKSRVHGANYGIGAKKAGEIAGTSENKAREDLNKYYNMYMMLKIWHIKVRDQLGKTRIMTTPFGRKRMFFGRWSEDLVREAIAYVPQSTVGDLLNLGLTRSWHNLPPEWSLLMQNHDAVLAQVPEEAAPEHIHKFFHHYYEIPTTIHGRTFTIPMDIKIGKNWGTMKKLEVKV